MARTRVSVAVAFRQLGQGRGQLGGAVPGVQAVGDPVLRTVHSGFFGRDQACGGAQAAHLGAEVVAEQIGGDAEEPGAGPGAGRVVGVALAQGHREGLGQQIFRRDRAGPAGQIAEQGRGMPVEQRGERLGRGQIRPVGRVRRAG